MRPLSLILMMAIGALLYQGGVTAYNSDSLELKTFDIEGNSGRRVSDDQLVVASGVDPGSKLLKISIQQVETNIAAIPWIEDVSAERLLPSTLRIRIAERRPRMQVVTQAGPFLVDSDGKVLQQGSENLVQLLELPLNTLVAGETVLIQEFVHASRILSSLPREVRAAVGSINAPTIDRISLQIESGPQVFYGAAEQIEEKNFALESLLLNKDVNVPGASIDVRVPSRPSVKSLSN